MHFFPIVFKPHTSSLYFPLVAHEIWNGSFVCSLVGLSAWPHAAHKLWEVSGCEFVCRCKVLVQVVYCTLSWLMVCVRQSGLFEYI